VNEAMSDDKVGFGRRKNVHRWSLAAWFARFHCAFRGWWLGSCDQSSFRIHYLAAVFVIGLGSYLGCELWEWVMLVLCISVVWMAELMNSAIEALSRAVTLEYDERIRDALDIASGAVLVVSLGSAVIGSMIFLPKLLQLFF